MKLKGAGDCVRLWLLIVVAVFGYCEWLHYYLVLTLCSWPLPQSNGGVPHLRVLLLADPHLLGPRKGHWFDKLRREWQMHRAFVTARTLFQPEVVFILGDLFDEGQWSDSQGFRDYADRLKQLFPTDQTCPLVATVGNHDIGFHYAIWEGALSRFQKEFGGGAVRLLRMGGNFFVLLNSMAWEQDGCRLCAEAEKQLSLVNATLACLRNSNADYRCDLLLDDLRQSPDNRDGDASFVFSQPILLQHFPLHRLDDSHCTEADGASEAERRSPFRQRWDVLSDQASALLRRTLQPRAAFDGHSHNGCRTWHSLPGSGRGFWEWTLSSFSWRNRNNPAFLLALISPSEVAVSKCLMPQESTVITIYCLAAFLLFLTLLSVFWSCLRRVCRPKLKV